MRIKTNYVGNPAITPGKEYDVYESQSWGSLCIMDDEGDELALGGDFTECAHLHGNSWTIVEDEQNRHSVKQN